MVVILINGRKSHREFQNMAQALVFAGQNGDCINAEKVELAYTAKSAAKNEKHPITGDTGGGSTGLGGNGSSSNGGTGSGAAK